MKNKIYDNNLNKFVILTLNNELYKVTINFLTHIITKVAIPKNVKFINLNFPYS
jgi:hypothetical protein